MIRFFHLAKRWPHGQEALSDVSLEIGEGELALLLGPSGAGKSTMIRLILGAERPTEGQVLVGERNLGRIPPAEMARHRREIGVVFQDFRLLDGRKAWENVALALEVRGIPRKSARDEAIEALQRLGLEERIQALPPSLSGGEKQRLAIARALVGAPRLLLLDEPTAHLDADWAQEVMELIALRVEAGATAVLATHDPLLARRFPHRVFRISSGAVREEAA